MRQGPATLDADRLPPEDPPPPGDWRLGQLVTDTYELSKVGGFLYLFGWAVIAGLAGVFGFAPGLAGAIALVFLVLAWLRWSMRPPAVADDAARRRWLLRYGVVLPLPSAAWSAVQAWILVDPRFTGEIRMVSLVATIGYATVFANIYSTVRRLAAAGVCVMFAPVLVLLWIDPAQRALAIAMTFYALYLAGALVRSHAEYRRRLRLDLALRQQRDRFEQLSRTDPLTGLHNRRHFTERLEALAGGGAPGVVLVILDLDHFKDVNDRHGHAAGDACLQAFAARLREAFPAPAMLARLGGEEFGVLLERVPAASALARAEAFRASLAARPLATPRQALAITTSIGLGAFDPVRHGDADGLYRAVDGALYEAKRAGRDRVRQAGVAPAAV